MSDDDEDILKKIEGVGHMWAYAMAFLIFFGVIIAGAILCFFIGVFLYAVLNSFMDWINLKFQSTTPLPCHELPRVASTEVRVPPIVTAPRRVPPMLAPPPAPTLNLVAPETPLTLPCDVPDAIVVDAQYAPVVKAPNAL